MEDLIKKGLDKAKKAMLKLLLNPSFWIVVLTIIVAATVLYILDQVKNAIAIESKSASMTIEGRII